MEHQHEQAEPLQSRHIFLDTQVYRALQHDPENQALKVLQEQIDAQRVVLHIADITLLEIKRQISEQVEARLKVLKELEHDFARWRRSAAATAPNPISQPNSQALSDDLFRSLRSFIRFGCSATIHNALSVNPSTVFASYFDRSPPFGGGKKEFPDGFVLESLRAWCEANDERMYIVTEDKAMAEAASANPRFLWLGTIKEVLKRGGANLGAAGEVAAGAAMKLPNFRPSLGRELGAKVAVWAFDYVGGLAEGEVEDLELEEIEEIEDWSVVGLSEKSVTLVVEVLARVRGHVRHKDFSSATYDSEDGRWVNAQTATSEVEDFVQLKAMVNVDRESGTVREATILDDVITISEGFEL